MQNAHYIMHIEPNGAKLQALLIKSTTTGCDWWFVAHQLLIEHHIFCHFRPNGSEMLVIVPQGKWRLPPLKATPGQSEMSAPDSFFAVPTMLTPARFHASLSFVVCKLMCERANWLFTGNHNRWVDIGPLMRSNDDNAARNNTTRTVEAAIALGYDDRNFFITLKTCKAVSVSRPRLANGAAGGGNDARRRRHVDASCVVLPRLSAAELVETAAGDSLVAPESLRDFWRHKYGVVLPAGDFDVQKVQFPLTNMQSPLLDYPACCLLSSAGLDQDSRPAIKSAAAVQLRTEFISDLGHILNEFNGDGAGLDDESLSAAPVTIRFSDQLHETAPPAHAFGTASFRQPPVQPAPPVAAKRARLPPGAANKPPTAPDDGALDELLCDAEMAARLSNADQRQRVTMGQLRRFLAAKRQPFFALLERNACLDLACRILSVEQVSDEKPDNNTNAQ